MEKEVWKSIIGFEGIYEVSNLGRVKSLNRTIYTLYGFRKIKGRILKNRFNGRYLQVVLYKKGETKSFLVHQLVAMSFLNHKPDRFNMVVDHINNDKLNNNSNNLNLVTQRQNLSKKEKKTSSKFTGVCFDKNSGKWKSSIFFNGKCIHLGLFVDEIEAHKCYQKQIKELC